VSAQPAAEKRGFTQKMLGGVETLGNKVPHPALMFFGLCILVILLSWVLALADVKVTYEVADVPPIPVEETYVGGSQQVVPEVPPTYENPDPVIHTATTKIESLISFAGARFIFSSFVTNFANFSVVAVIFVAMIGVGVAEKAGLMAALIRKLVAVAPARAITFIIVLVGILSSIASDAGYLILIPLGAAAFASLGRHPLAGMAAAYAGVGAAFGVNILITPIDSLVTEITNEAIAIADPNRSLNLTANLYFNIVATFFLAIVITFVIERIIEPGLGTWTPAPGTVTVTGDEDQTPEERVKESKGLRAALYGMLVSIVLVALLVAPSGAPLRNPVTDSIVENSPFMDSLIFIITIIFLVAGVCYGLSAKTLASSTDIINGVTETFAGLSGLIFMLLLIAQFIAYFNFSNMPTVAAVEMADLLERADIGAIWLLIGFIIVIAILDIIIPGVAPKWAIFAPIFIPLFLRLDVAPQTVLAAYRVGDSPVNVITPLMVYLPFIVLVAQRYKKDAGIGTVVSLMLPVTGILLLMWTLFFVVWYLLGIPFGPGYPVHL
jgi:aminobenzoyl-glutamate transport protein